MPPTTPTTYLTLALAPLVAWRVYVRFPRASGRQRLSPYRGPITLTLYTLLVGEVALGVGLAAYALRRTRLEPTPTGLYYTPYAPIGLSLAAPFVARLAYRLVEVYALDTATLRSFGEFARSPLTLAAFGLMAGYYAAHMGGLVRWRRRVLRAKREREARQGQ